MNITVYCGSNFGDNPHFEEAARNSVSYTHLDVYKRQTFNHEKPQLFLERGHVLAKRRLRHAELGRRTAEVQMLRKDNVLPQKI